MRVDSSKASGLVYKRVVCEKCSCVYRYELVRHARALPFLNFIKMVLCVLCFPVLMALSLFRPISLWGGRSIYLLRYRHADRLRDTMLLTLREGGDEFATTTNAVLRAKLLKGVESVPCPNCAWLQSDMVADIRSRSRPWIDFLGVGMLAASQALAIGAMNYTASQGFYAMVYAWCLCTFGGFFAMFAMMIVRWWLSLSVDPNDKFPAPPGPFPGAPPAIPEEQRQKEVAANTAQLLGSIRKSEVPFRPTAILPNSALPGK